MTELVPSRPTWRRLLAYLAPYKLPVTLAVLAKLLSSAMFLALPAVLNQFVDRALGSDSLRRLNEMTLLLLGAFALLTAGTIIGHYFTNSTGERIVRDLRRQLYTHLQSLSLGFFVQQRSGELISRMSSDVSAIRSLLTVELTKVVRHVITITGAAVIMVVLNWRLTLFTLLTVPVIVLIGVVLTRLARRGGMQVQDTLAQVAVLAQESFQNVREVKSFGREPYQIDRYTAGVNRTLRASLRLARARAVLVPLMHFLFLTNIALILWYGGREVIADRLTRGELIGFLVYVAIIGQMISELGMVYSQYQETVGATRRVFQLLDTRPLVADAPDAQALDRAEGRITFDDVSFHYEDRQPVLNGINLDIAPGEIVALVGPSGAGKSTIFNLIPRFYDVTGGAVRIDGRDVRQITQASLRAQIGIVPQETLLFGGSIRENILFGRLDAGEDEMIEAARAANAHDFVTAMPDGYETIVGERGIRLSGGQRQRIAIARAILKDPAILLLDEATSSLDNESEHLVQDALERLMHGRTTVIIAHRLSTVRVAHRLAVLQSGRIVELGTHDELMALNGLYTRLYEMQFHAQMLLAAEGGAQLSP